MDQKLFSALSSHLHSDEISKNVAIVGSAPDAPLISNLLSRDATVVAINNAWQVVPRTDISIYPADFAAARRHPRAKKIGRGPGQYLPAMQRFGGIMLCGATMALAAGYWALNDFPCSQISFFACDMIYAGERTHFYGAGTADPLRQDITLQNLTAKQLRLFYFGVRSRTLFLNASPQPETRLIFPRVKSGLCLSHNIVPRLIAQLDRLDQEMSGIAEEALAKEKKLSLDTVRPDYWYCMDSPEAWKEIASVDDAWLALSDKVSAFSRIVDGEFSVV